jgi:hypothetical protein
MTHNKQTKTHDNAPSPTFYNLKEPIYSMLGIALGSRAFKANKSFLEKASILSFSQKCIFAVFKVKKSKKYL